MAANTVKVHIHNIMKKLKATNRTEAIFKIAGRLLICTAEFMRDIWRFMVEPRLTVHCER